MQLVRHNAGILRVSIVLTVVATAAITWHIMRDPEAEYYARRIPTRFFEVYCDTNGVRIQQLRDELALIDRNIARESEALPAARAAEKNAFAIAMSELELNARLGANRLTSGANLMRDAQTNTSATLARLASGQRRRDELLRSIADRVRVGRRTHHVAIESLDINVWPHPLADSGFQEHFNIGLRRYSYLVLPVGILTGCFLAFTIVGHVIAVLVRSTARLLRWVAAGFVSREG